MCWNAVGAACHSNSACEHSVQCMYCAFDTVPRYNVHAHTPYVALPANIQLCVDCCLSSPPIISLNDG